MKNRNNSQFIQTKIFALIKIKTRKLKNTKDNIHIIIIKSIVYRFETYLISTSIIIIIDMILKAQKNNNVILVY